MKINRPELSELAVAIAIIVALILLINPFDIIMTSAFTLSLIMILAVAIIAFGVFVWHEQPRDEREAVNSLKSGHIAYFAGGTVLVIAIITEASHHKLDIWLPIALGAMVVTKLIVGSWNKNK